MSDIKVYDVLPEAAARAHITEEKYQEMYARSIADPDGFWAEQAREFVTWFKEWDQVQNWNYHEGKIRWFEGAKLNVSYNCLDRHLETRADQVAIIWEGDDPGVDEEITYRELHEKVCRLANVLKSRGVKKGDRVCIYLPMIPEAAVAMLACTRIGAVHSIVFGGFSPEALKDRIQDSGCEVVITSDEGMRGGRSVSLKGNVDKALIQCPDVNTVIVVKHTGRHEGWQDGRDIWYHEEIEKVSADCPPEEMIAKTLYSFFILQAPPASQKGFYIPPVVICCIPP
jgi:acetyl-CoA synthetase